MGGVAGDCERIALVSDCLEEGFSQDVPDGLVYRELATARRTPYLPAQPSRSKRRAEAVVLSAVALRAGGEPVEEEVTLVALALGAVARARAGVPSAGGAVMSRGWGVMGEAA